MRKLFNIDQDEKNRILEMHENATKRHYLNEYSGVAFGDEQNGLKIEKVETTEQPEQPGVSSHKQQLISKFNAMFPPKTWYKQAMEGSKLDVADPNYVKLYNVYRKYVDNNVPDLSMNQGSEFLDWLTSKGGNSKLKDHVNWVASIHTGTEPVLMASNYPNTIQYKVALANALKSNPTLSKNFIISNNLPTIETVYQDVVKNV